MAVMRVHQIQPVSFAFKCWKLGNTFQNWKLGNKFLQNNPLVKWLHQSRGDVWQRNRCRSKHKTSLQHLLSRHGSGYNEILVSKPGMAGSGAYVLFGSLFASMGICKSSVPLMNDLHSTQCPEPAIFDLYDNLERFIMSAYLCQGSCQDDSCRRGPGESVNCFNQHASLENRHVST